MELNGSARTFEQRLLAAHAHLGTAVTDPMGHLLALLFWHEASRDDSPMSLAPGDRITAIAGSGLGAQADAALSRVAHAHRRQLHEAFAQLSFAGVSDTALNAALRDVDAAAAQALPVVDEGDMLGQAYMHLKASSAKRARGEFYTPMALAAMLPRMLSLAPGQTVVDPACGSGRLLLAALNSCRERHGADDAATVMLYGIEISPQMAAVARMNMVLAGAGDQATIVCADALDAPVFYRPDGNPVQFDVVIANPPFGGI